ncbi:MAG: family 78 glycoside hydrolase catalytic domain [Clostridia bacterium]|nr:family 78 glycoside hydrolase catalytic domain [Clostridia bacterium]
MFTIDRVYLDYGRMYPDKIRSHYTENEKPVIGWSVLNGRKGAKQSAVQLFFALGSGEILWDSGKVMTEDSSVRYDGIPLPGGKRVNFSLRVWDDENSPSHIYEDYIFNVNVKNWDAAWIGKSAECSEQVIRLRKGFSIDKPVRDAYLYACGIGYHKFYLDGQLLDGAEMDPSFSDYRGKCEYVFIPELQKKLNAGDHMLSARVAPGWRNNPGTKDIFGVDVAFYGPQQMTAFLVLDYEDGTREIISTDETWECAPDAYISATVFNGTRFDASMNSDEWMKADACGDFEPAVILPAPGGKMRPMLIPAIREGKVRKAIAAWPVENGVVFDFGQNLAGVLRIKLGDDLRKGQEISLRHAEELTEEGLPFYDTLRTARAQDIYIAAGEGKDAGYWQPEFTYHGFRYAIVEGMGTDIDPDSVEAVELHTDLEKDSSFRCGNALVTEIHRMCVETERGNMHSVLTDCPQRDERLQWLNDATVRFEEIPYNFEIGRMFPKVVRDILAMQNEEGAFGCTMPFVIGSIPADPVCSSFLIAGYEAMLHTGNIDIIREGYEGFCAWEECLLKHSDDYIVNYSHYGDWAGPAYACEEAEVARSGVTPGIYMSTGYSYLNCLLLARMAEWLGMEDEAKRHMETAGKIHKAILDKWYDADKAVMATGSQAAQAFALWLGIIPEEDRQRAADNMRGDLVKNDYQFTTGNLCTKYMLQMLSKYGYHEDAWKIMTKETYPSFGYMLQQEATTIWERFELKENAGMNSHNHPMYASADHWIYSVLAGVEPIESGWKKFRIAPVLPENLLSCQAVVDTIMGSVQVRWFRRYGKQVLHVNVPFGCTAEVKFAGEVHEAGSGFHVFEKAL